MKKYDHIKIEKKWQKEWEKQKLYEVTENSNKKKSYLLVEFPYPSGDGLHVGHPRPYVALDIIARKRRGEGFNVLFPIGWDAFGLPTENYAIKTGTHPREVTKKNTKIFKKQIQSLGLSFDWSREINTSDPKYYKWTQWIFLQLYKKGLAYKTSMPINWCIDCKIGLANEELVDEVCERCGGKVETREKEQWMLAITKYADRLDKDLDDVDYLEKIKVQQRNWIGRSEGVEIKFEIKNKKSSIDVFTTRADTLFGATYMVLAPEHPLIKNLGSGISNLDEVRKYIAKAKKKTDIERTAEGQEKTGVELKGVEAINPANKEEVPVYVADYVLAHYGTGAIMAVPAHDERDYEFAKKYDLPVVEVITGGDIKTEAFTGEGVLTNSGKFSGLLSEEAKEKIAAHVKGKKRTTYKLRDWIFSRQRYWGEPIPIIHCEKCGMVPVPEEDLPVELPDVEKYQPTDSGESPLAAIESFVNTECPKCGGKAVRETDTMPNWAGSSWYYLRYTDPHNDKALADSDKLKYWTPVDWYNGGMEHTTLHLLYSRFWHKFLYDIGIISTHEPYQKRTSHGLILAEGGAKMSKSKGNVINPDDVVKNVGADTLRVYEMFMGPFEQSIAWSTDNLVGSRRFLDRVWNLSRKVEDRKISESILPLLHKTIQKVGDDIEKMKFNTAVSQLMILTNELEKMESVPTKVYTTLLRLLAPIAPHITEELWSAQGGKRSIHQEEWPSYDEKKLAPMSHIIVVQINGKVRAKFEASIELTETQIKEKSLKMERILEILSGKKPQRIIYVPHKLVNIVTSA